MAKNETAAEHARRCIVAINHRPDDCPSDQPPTTAALLGAYGRELKDQGIDAATANTLVIEAARQLLRDDLFCVRKEVATT